MSGDQALIEKQRATALGALLNLPLALVKILVGVVGQSQALLADGIHSAADLISDAIVFTAVRAGNQGADADHPYGHARIETAATGGVSLFLLLTAIALVYDGCSHIAAAGTLPRPGVAALVVALVSLALKEGLFWYTRYVAQRTRSPLLEANAWHHRSDALSSVAALAGIGGAIAGYPVSDGIATVIIAVMLAVIGVRYGWRSVRELIDTGLEPERLRAVRDQIITVPGVRRMRRLRTRVMGGHDAFADVGVFVDPDLSLTEAHRISEEISARLVESVDEIADICVHIEPEGQADAPAAHALPLRDTIVPELRSSWSKLEPAAAVHAIMLHYVNDGVVVDVTLPLTFASDDDHWSQAFDQAAKEVDGVAGARLFYTRPADSKRD